MKSIFATVAIFFMAFSMAFAQAPSNDNLPFAFILGEHADEYDAMTQEYSNMLLDECDGDMQKAYTKWMGMLHEMEAYAKEINYNLDGVQVWMNVFWNKDGSIKHIAFYTKPESRVVPLGELTAFIKSFGQQYKFPLMTKEDYVHYGHAFFPTAPKRVARK